ncbi:metallopeptidase family protein [soil metagenome]
MAVHVSAQAFDSLVDQALDLIPDDLAVLVDNLAVLVAEHPPPSEPPDTLGLYDGLAITDGPPDLFPARIYIFRQPLMAICDSAEELVEEVKVTVIHEVAHHFGIDDERLHRLGWA